MRNESRCVRRCAAHAELRAGDDRRDHSACRSLSYIVCEAGQELPLHINPNSMRLTTSTG